MEFARELLRCTDSSHRSLFSVGCCIRRLHHVSVAVSFVGSASTFNGSIALPVFFCFGRGERQWERLEMWCGYFCSVTIVWIPFPGFWILDFVAERLRLPNQLLCIIERSQNATTRCSAKTKNKGQESLSCSSGDFEPYRARKKVRIHIEIYL